MDQTQFRKKTKTGMPRRMKRSDRTSITSIALACGSSTCAPAAAECTIHRQPELAPLGLLRWDHQPLASPDTLDPLVVDYPARLAHQFGDRLGVPQPATRRRRARTPLVLVGCIRLSRACCGGVASPR